MGSSAAHAVKDLVFSLKYGHICIIEEILLLAWNYVIFYIFLIILLVTLMINQT